MQVGSSGKGKSRASRDKKKAEKAERKQLLEQYVAACKRRDSLKRWEKLTSFGAVLLVPVMLIWSGTVPATHWPALGMLCVVPLAALLVFGQLSSYITQRRLLSCHELGSV